MFNAVLIRIYYGIAVQHPLFLCDIVRVGKNKKGVNAAATLSAGVQAEKGRLYAVIQVRENGSPEPHLKGRGCGVTFSAICRLSAPKRYHSCDCL